MNTQQYQLFAHRRQIKAKLAELSKQHDIDFSAEEIPNSQYTCSTCRHHGVLAIKKYHVPCPFASCRCEWCSLNEQKAMINLEIKRMQLSERAGEWNHSPSTSNSEESAKPCFSTEEALSPEAKVIFDLLNVLSIDPTAFNPDDFDYQALSNFFSQPYILVPASWIPQIHTIFDLVRDALTRFPILQPFDFHSKVVYSFDAVTHEYLISELIVC